MSNDKDFSVRNLSEYPVEELEMLYEAMVDRSLIATREEEQLADIWLYRIRDAIKEAKKNEHSVFEPKVKDGDIVTCDCGRKAIVRIFCSVCDRDEEAH